MLPSSGWSDLYSRPSWLSLDLKAAIFWHRLNIILFAEVKTVAARTSIYRCIFNKHFKCFFLLWQNAISFSVNLETDMKLDFLLFFTFDFLIAKFFYSLLSTLVFTTDHFFLFHLIVAIYIKLQNSYKGRRTDRQTEIRSRQMVNCIFSRLHL